MSEFFLELFSEEMPPNLQCSIRETLIQNIKNFLDKEQINYDEKNNCFSTPNRLIIHFKKIEKEEVKKSQEFICPNGRMSVNGVCPIFEGDDGQIKDFNKPNKNFFEFDFVRALVLYRAWPSRSARPSARA